MKKIHLGGKPPQRGVDITIEILTARKPPELLWYAADEKEAVRIRKKGLRSILVPKILYNKEIISRFPILSSYHDRNSKGIIMQLRADCPSEPVAQQFHHIQPQSAPACRSCVHTVKRLEHSVNIE